MERNIERNEYGEIVSTKEDVLNTLNQHAILTESEFKVKKIDTSKIRGCYTEIFSNGHSAGGDDTVKSILLVAEKLNELIDSLDTSFKE